MESFRIIAFSLIFIVSGYFCEDNPCRHALAKSGEVVDLKNLSGHQFITFTPNQTYIFSICEDSKKIPSNDFVDNNNTCTRDGYSLCFYDNISPNNSRILTKTADWKWTESDDSEDKTNICLSASKDNLQIRIHLVCVTLSHESTYFGANSSVNQTGNQKIVTEFLLFSPLACPRKIIIDDGLSTGTVLLIILLVAFFTYLSIGIIVNFFLVGARGAEVIPNIQFWRNLPSLVIDGIRFLQNGCKVRSSDLAQGRDRDTYDSI